MSEKKQPPQASPPPSPARSSDGFAVDPSFWEDEAPPAPPASLSSSLRSTPQNFLLPPDLESTPTSSPQRPTPSGTSNPFSSPSPPLSASSASKPLSASSASHPAPRRQDNKHASLVPPEASPSKAGSPLLHSYLHEVAEQKEAGLSSEQAAVLPVIEKQQQHLESSSTRRLRAQPLLLIPAEEGSPPTGQRKAIPKLLWLIPIFTLIALAAVFLFRKPSLEELLRAKRYKEALPLLQAESRWREIGDIHRAQGQRNEALAAYQKADAWLEMASYLYSLKEYKQAGDLYAKALDWLRAAEAYKQAKQPLLAARVLLKSGAKKQALALFLQADAHEEALPLLLAENRQEEAAQLYEKRGLPAQAAAIYRAMRKHEKAFAAYEKAGDAFTATQMLLAMQQYPQAAKRFARLRAVRCLGVAQQAAQQHSQASKIFTLAAQQDRSFALLLRAAQQAEQASGLRASRKLLAQALTLVSSFQEPKSLIQVHEMMGDTNKALRTLQMWLKEAVKDERTADALRFVEASLAVPDLPMLTQSALQQQKEKLTEQLQKLPHLRKLKASYSLLSPRSEPPQATQETTSPPSPQKTAQKNTTPPTQKTTPQANDGNQQKTSSFQLSLHAEISLPPNPPKALQLKCSLFRKDPAVFGVKSDQHDDPEGLDLCLHYRGTQADLDAFDQGPAGHRIEQRLSITPDIAQKPLRLTLSVPAAYRFTHCSLAPSTEEATPQKEK